MTIPQFFRCCLCIREENESLLDHLNSHAVSHGIEVCERIHFSPIRQPWNVFSSSYACESFSCVIVLFQTVSQAIHVASWIQGTRGTHQGVRYLSPTDLKSLLDQQETKMLNRAQWEHIRIVGLNPSMVEAPTDPFMNILETHFGLVKLIDHFEWDSESSSYTCLVTYQSKPNAAAAPSFQSTGNHIHLPLSLFSDFSSSSSRMKARFPDSLQEQSSMAHIQAKSSFHGTGYHGPTPPPSRLINHQMGHLSMNECSADASVLTPWSQSESFSLHHHGLHHRQSFHRPSRSDTSWISVDSQRSSTSSRSVSRVPDHDPFFSNHASHNNVDVPQLEGLQTPLWLRGGGMNESAVANTHTSSSTSSLFKPRSEPLFDHGTWNKSKNSHDENNPFLFAGRNEMMTPLRDGNELKNTLFDHVHEHRLGNNNNTNRVSNLLNDATAVKDPKTNTSQLLPFSPLSCESRDEAITTLSSTSSLNVSRMWNYIRRSHRNRVSPMLESPNDPVRTVSANKTMAKGSNSSCQNENKARPSTHHHHHESEPKTGNLDQNVGENRQLCTKVHEFPIEPPSSSLHHPSQMGLHSDATLGDQHSLLSIQPVTSHQQISSSSSSLSQESIDGNGDCSDGWKHRCTPYLKNLSLEKILQGQESRTTVMIRNIPNKYTQDMFKSFLDNELGFFGQYDFLYLRMDFVNKCNVGYAFVNFVTPSTVLEFIQKAVGNKWPMFKSEKVCSMSFAAIQGQSALIERFRNSSVMLEPEPYRPKLFSTAQTSSRWGQELAFPPPTSSGYRPKSDVLFSRTHAAAGPF